MSLDFVDLDDPSQAVDEPGPLAPGVVLQAEDGSWIALRAPGDVPFHGTGPLGSLEKGLWIVDKPYEEAVVLGRRLRGISVRSDDYLKVSLTRIRSTWGLAGQRNADAIGIVSKVAARIHRLVSGAITPDARRLGFGDAGGVAFHLDRSSSLATGIAAANADALGLSADDDASGRMADHFLRAWQSGIYIADRKGREEGSVTLGFAHPRLGYALRIAGQDVPATATWQAASRKEGQSSPEFVAAVTAIGKPAIFRASCRPGHRQAPEYVEAYANGIGSANTYRTRYLGCEIEALSRHQDVSAESVLRGDRWIPSATGALLRNLEASAGGPDAARASWSVGIAAENILASAFRKVRKDAPGRTAEAVWIAARDRTAMLPAIQAIYDVGAVLVSAHLGRIVVRCPRDPEVLMLVVNAAWERGLVGDMDDGEALSACGVDMPSDPSLFGGENVDTLLSCIAQQRRRRALWVLDAIQDEPSSARAKAFRLKLS